MKIYLEFEGNKLTGTECINYQEARYIIIKILDQCMLRYKKYHNKKLFGHEEEKLQHKILSKLRFVVT